MGIGVWLANTIPMHRLIRGMFVSLIGLVLWVCYQWGDEMGLNDCEVRWRRTAINGSQRWTGERCDGWMREETEEGLGCAPTGL